MVGYLFGYAHFGSNLLWLNEVGFGAGSLLALWCALFPMVWYVLFSAFVWRCKQDLTQPFPGAGFIFIKQRHLLLFSALFAASLWCSLEWVRGWLLTGFPWNQLGISQYRRIGLLQTAAYTGVSGLSFLIVLTNAILALEATRLFHYAIIPRKLGFPWHFAMLMLFLIPVCWWGSQPKILAPESAPQLTALAVQGNLPQCRFWRDEDFQQALDSYVGLTRQAVVGQPAELLPDLIVWPESAVPAELEYHDYAVERYKLLQEINIPLLVGATQFRLPHNNATANDAMLFNSAFLLNGKGQVVEYYDKIRRVPFGEYTPFSKQLPWLQEMIGMGRDLTPGKELHVFNLPKGAYAGVNICFEDVFADMSRNFTRKGANVLMTITNDSWYNQSSGAEQHLSHVIFRAVENRRPLLRVGNNSHTCLITPNGEILGQIVNDETGSVFAKGSANYELPLYDWGETFYTKHGEVFVQICNVFTAAVLAWMMIKFLQRKKRLLEAVAGKS